MKQITIDTGSTSGVAAFSIFQKEGLERGDTLRIVRRPSLSQEGWVMLVLLIMNAASYFLKKKSGGKQAPEVDDFMTELAQSSMGVADLRKELKQEHDLQVETDPPVDDEYDAWRQFAAYAMSRAYSEDEPDISHITLLEPNPDYKPWKPGK